MSKKYLLKLFDILIFNKRKNDRKLACWIARKHFNDSIEKKLFLAWEKFNDAQLIVPLIENGKISIDLHYAIIEKLLKDESVEDWIKRKLLLLLAKKDFEAINFIKNSDPVTYLYIATKLDQEVEEEYIIKIILNLDDSSLLGLVIWCIGKMGKRDLLLKLHPMSDEIEKRIFDNM